MSVRSTLLSTLAIWALISGAAVAEDSAVECEREWIVGDLRTAPGEEATAAVVENGRFIAVGSEELPPDEGSGCVTELPEGAVAFAGFHDGHAHLLGIGLREMTLNLEGTSSIEDLKSRVAAEAKTLKKGETLYGRGWIETGWPDGRMPTREDIDDVVNDRPVILQRADGHATVVNTRALAAAGIHDETEDPEGGRILRDANGVATGLLIDKAEDLVEDLKPKLTPERRREALKLGAETYAKLGWTAIHNMSVGVEDEPILYDLAEKGELPLRVMNYMEVEALPALSETGPTCTENKLVCTRGIKLYLDGALGSRGALLFGPYSDDPENRGLLLTKRTVAQEYFDIAKQAGLQVAVHAIGDRANRLAFDWLWTTLIIPKVENHRWRIEHAQILRTDDIPRFAKQGLIASMQPSHAIGDLFFAKDRLGDNRLAGAYAWRSIMERDGVLVSGSDAPVEKGDPRIEIHAATRRMTLDGYEGDHWHPEQALTAEQALATFTTNAAYAVFMEDELGKIAPGYRADMTVFSADPFTTPWDEVDVIMTMVEGTRYE